MATTAWGEKPATAGSSDPNVLQLKEASRIRLLEPSKRSWRQHGIESPKDTDQFDSCVCPRGADGRGDGDCPLCKKPTLPDGKERFPISRRFATNVWDYESGSVKVLIAGPQVFSEFDAAAQLGMDPTASDWLIHKMGEKKQTTYKLIRGNDTPLDVDITPDMLHDLDKYESAESVEKIFEKLEKLGIDYDALEVPVYTLDQALAVVIPFGKHKGMTVEQILAVDDEYLEWLYGTRREQGQYGDGLFIALHTVLESRGLVAPLDDALPKAPPKAAPMAEPSMVKLVPPGGGEPQEFPSGSAGALLAAGFTEYVEPQPDPEPEASGMVTLVGADGQSIEVPVAQKDALLAAGFTEPVPGDDPTTAFSEPQPTDEVLVDVSGTKATMLYAAAKPLIDAGAATLLGATGAATPEPEPLFEFPADDTKVFVKLAALPEPIEMPWGQVKPLVDGGQATIPDATLAIKYAESKDGTTPDPADDVRDEARTGAVEPSSETSALADPLSPELTAVSGDKFVHPALPGKEYKTKGAVTQALNRARSANGGTTAEAATPAATPATTAPENTPKGDALERCKNLLAQAPEIQNDFKKLLDIFTEVAGKRNITDFTEPELNKLEGRLQQEIAGATA